VNATVISYTNDYREPLRDFNHRVYSNRLGLKNQTAFKLAITALTPSPIARLNHQVVGQLLLFPATYHYKNARDNFYFGYDYIVDPTMLNTGIGFKMLSDVVKNHPHVGIGLSDVSKRLHLLLKEKLIGSLDKFLWLNGLLPKLFLAIDRFLKFQLLKPSSLTKIDNSYRHNGFEIVHVDQNKGSNIVWNPNLLEFGRAEIFYQMRYERIPNQYHHFEVVSKNGLVGTFTIRSAFWRGINVLILVDYRYKILESAVFAAIINTLKTIVRTNGFQAVLTGSSLAKVDEQLLQSGFLKGGIPAEIVTNIRLNESPEDVSSRNIIFATLADSDADFNLGEGLWND
jgi:hypothetical protein